MILLSFLLGLYASVLRVMRLLFTILTRFTTWWWLATGGCYSRDPPIGPFPILVLGLGRRRLHTVQRART